MREVICERCDKNPATEKWAESGTMFARGFYENWCKKCVLEVQLAHAKERANKVDELQAELDALDV